MIPSRLLRAILKNVVVLLLVFACAKAASSQPLRPGYFEEIVERRFSTGEAKVNWSLEKFCPVSTSAVAARVLEAYGAMWVANDFILLPQSCIQTGESDVVRYQKTLKTKRFDVGGVSIELQAASADALQRAVDEAATSGFGITPLDGAIAGGRSYGDTLMLWNSRVFPAMEFWMTRGRLPVDARDQIARLDQQKKVEKVLEWESQGIFFSTDRSRSIFTSTAPPGTSQHLALIAFDVTEFWNARVRAIMNRNGWFQTVIDDPAHFTYLGFAEAELPARGLIAVSKGRHQYWVPNMLSKRSTS